MFIESYAYSQFVNTSREWQLKGCTFGNINLIVGKNSTGKTMVLNTINALASLLAGEQRLNYVSGNYTVTFKNETGIKYELKYDEQGITKEIFSAGGRKWLQRQESGIGKVFYQTLGKNIKFQIPSNELAVVKRRDTLQHPFFEDLYSWANSVRLYQFGTYLGKDRLILLIEAKSEAEKQRINLKDTTNAIGIFLQGEKRFPKKFTQAILGDMKNIGYEVDKIGVSPPFGMVFQGNVPKDNIVGLFIKEKSLSETTDQQVMSQGMFRALSLIIQINYSRLAETAGCLLIDDIGEGLDFERSSSLIKLLIKKVKDTSIQLIMSTNDRFVMNNVPLEYWSIIHREGNLSQVFNYRNSPKLFDKFRLMGLSNFDFFSSRYYLEGNVGKN